MISIENIKKYYNTKKILKSDDLDKYYTIFKVKKKSWWYREITAPKKELLYIQRKIKSMIESEIDAWNITLDDYITWFMRWKSIRDNASFHTWKKFILNIDIQNFFPSISSRSIYKKFQYIVDDIQLFIYITTYKGRLPQWSPCSPIIANIVFSDIDIAIKNYLEKQQYINIWYSRYADDISISFDNQYNKDKLMKDIIQIIWSHWFKINKDKTSFKNHKTKMIVTWLVVNKRVAFPKYNYRLVRSILFNLLKHGYWYYPQIKWILSFVKSVDEKKYNLLKETYKVKFSDNSIYYEIFNIDINGEEKQERPIDFLWNKKIKNDTDKNFLKEYHEDLLREYHEEKLRESTLREAFPDWGSGSFDQYLEWNWYG